MRLSIGKYRGLQQCSSDQKTFSFLALDHRQNLRRALDPDDPSSVTDSDLTRFKLDVTAQLGKTATAVLLDPQYSAAQAISGGELPGSTPFVVAVESTGYGGDPTARQSQVLPGWSIEKAKRMGAAMVKLLVYYHPEATTASEIEQFVAQTAQECARQDLSLMLEPLSYSLDLSKPLDSTAKRHVVCESAKRLTLPGVDLLKAEFPLDLTSPTENKEWAAACEEISTLSRVPWILLSAAVDYDTYAAQVKAACQAGASGCAVGRAVWQEAVRLTGQARTKFLQEEARPRLEDLSHMCARFGRPWTDFYAPPEVSAEWYKTY